jgi:serine phosphatase RsbU (regulator of sigma subunit)
MGALFGLFRVLFLTCLGIVITIPTVGAMTPQDSLTAVIAQKMKVIFARPDSPAKTDSIEHVFEEYAWHIMAGVPPNTAISYAQKGLALAEKYQQYELQCYFLERLSIQYPRLGKHQEALRFAQEALRRAQKHDFVKRQLHIHERLLDIYNDLKQKDACLNTSRAMQRLFRTRYQSLNHSGEDLDLINTLMHYVYANYTKHNEFQELLDTLNALTTWIKKHPDPRIIFYTYRCYRTMGFDEGKFIPNQNEIISYYIKGLRLIEDIAARNPAYQRFLNAEYFYASMFFHQYYLFDMSLQYYRKARDHFLNVVQSFEANPKSNDFTFYDVENLAQTYANMSSIYSALGMPDSGYYSLKEALRYRIKNDHKDKIIDSYLMLSRSAIELRKPVEVLDLTAKGAKLIESQYKNEKIKKEQKLHYDYIISSYKAMAYEQLASHDSLKHYYFLSKKLMSELPSQPVHPDDFFRLKYKIASLAFLVRNALRFKDYDRIEAWNDSLNKYQTYIARLNQDIRSKESLVKFDVAGKEKLIAALNREKALEKERDAQQRRFIWALSIGLAATLGLGIIIYRQSLLRQKANRILSLQKNQIQHQKAELENAYEELNTTLEQVQTQKEEIARKNEKIEDSIRYAYQIQTAILPDPAVIQTALPKHFIFYQPKDIVSGDFYWLDRRDDYTFFCVADCTGHGVPGAFMSVMGSNALHYAIIELGLNDPDVILHALDRKIRTALRQERHSESKDGMDIGLCVWHHPSNRLHFAGAGRPLYHFSNGQITEIKGDKFPIGGGQYDEKHFTAHQISLNSGDRIYIFSDGITDQFGGSAKKKFTPKRLQEFILAEASQPLWQQSQIFHQTMNDWINGYAQLDDLTLLAVEV